MKLISKSLELEKSQYYETHLTIVNCFLPVKLTPTEIKVLGQFMSLRGDIAKDRFGTTAKKLVKSTLNLSDAGLSNYIRVLKQKGFLYDNNEELTILPILFPEADKQLYSFKLVNNDHMY